MKILFKLFILTSLILTNCATSAQGFVDKREELLKERINEIIHFAEENNIENEDFWKRYYYPDYIQFLSVSRSLKEFIDKDLIPHPDLSMKIINSLKKTLNFKPHFKANGKEAYFFGIKAEERPDFKLLNGVWYFYFGTPQSQPSEEKITSLQNTINEMIFSLEEGRFIEENFWTKFYYPPKIKAITKNQTFEEFINKAIVAHQNISFRIIKTLKNTKEHKPFFIYDCSEAIFPDMFESEHLIFVYLNKEWYFYINRPMFNKDITN